MFGLFSKKISKAACWTSFCTGVGFTLIHMIVFGMNFEAFSGIKQAVIDMNLPLNILSPINAGVFAMLLSVIEVPLISCFTKKPEKDVVENAFKALA